MASTQTGDGSGDASAECPICLDPCLHPVELPCKHTFCFLCIKGNSQNQNQSPLCPMCRASYPAMLLVQAAANSNSSRSSNSGTNRVYWYYQSHSGAWWQYDERTAAAIEESYANQESNVLLLIGGYTYNINFTTMFQARCSNSSYKRKIRRETSPLADSVGVAGIRT